MTKIFMDANIILDMLDSDRNNIKNSRKLVFNALKKGMTLYTSCDILSNIYYIARRKLEKEILVSEMLKIIDIFDIIAIDKNIAREALLKNQEKLSLDFEDLLQSECALIVKCDLIVTNDKKFVKSEVKHLNLRDALKII